MGMFHFFSNSFITVLHKIRIKLSKKLSFISSPLVIELATDAHRRKETEVRGRRSEVGGQKQSSLRGEKTEVGGQPSTQSYAVPRRTEIRRQKRNTISIVFHGVKILG
jgi:hypothetical protein